MINQLLVVLALVSAQSPIAPPSPTGPTSPPASSRQPPAVVRLVPPPPSRERLDTADVRLARDGTAIILIGTIGDGSASRFSQILAGAPNVRTVFLESSGGWMHEAEQIAAIVVERRLDTYVESGCLSACTLILIAGRDRAAAPVARIGFHQPQWVGPGAGNPDALRRSRAYFDRAGVPPTFIDRVMATPHSGAWFPSYEEMLAARVLTRRTLGGETSAVFSLLESREALRALLLTHISFWARLEARHPQVADRMLDTAWEVRSRGGSDAEVGNATRLVMLNSLPQILAGASDEVLDRYLALIVRQALAARSVSAEACDLLLKGQLNPMLTLPRELVIEEMSLTAQAIDSPPRQEGLNDARVDVIMQDLLGGMSEDEVGAIGSLEQPSPEFSAAERCDGMISFFRKIQALPDADRRIVTRNMLLSPS